MKNLVKVLLGILVVFSLTACNSKEETKEESAQEETVVEETDVTEEEVVEEVVVYATAEEAYDALVKAIEVDKSAFRFFNLGGHGSAVDFEKSAEVADSDEWYGHRVLRDADGNLFITYHNQSTGLRDLVFVINGEHFYFITSSFNSIENDIEVFDETKYSTEPIKTQLGLFSGEIFNQEAAKIGGLSNEIVFDASNTVDEGDYFIVTNNEQKNIYEYKIAKDGSSIEILFTHSEGYSGYAKMEVVEDVEIELPEVE